jgi:uncharacterized protein (DUF4415 family)
MKTIQFFSDEYLAHCKQLSADQIVKYLEDFRLINKPFKKTESKLISIKIETDLLETFKTKALLDGVPYQSRIKTIMRTWLKNEA